MYFIKIYQIYIVFVMLNFIKNIYKSFINFLYPKRCIGCKKEDTYICEDCLCKLKFYSYQVCPYCKKPSFLGKTHKKCKKTLGLDGLLVALPYNLNPIIKKMLKYYKFGFVKELDQNLSDIMIFPFLDDFLNYFYDFKFTFIPLHKKRFSYRGFDQAKLLCNHLSIKTGLEQIDILQRIKNTKQQSKLKKEKRKMNVENAFVLKEDIKNIQKIILVDDISSSLYTIISATKTIKKQYKDAIVYGMVICRN